MPAYQHVTVPVGGQKITVNKDFSLNVPDQPIIPYIEGDGTGLDITPVMLKVVDAAVAKAYGGKRKIHWMEVYAGEKSTKVYGADVWLPDETLAIVKDYVVSIKGPLTTPVGGGIRSLNVALRQQLDLYVCLRPVQYFAGVPSPVKAPEKINMVIFRENSEDIYAGIEWAAESDGAKKIVNFLINEMGVKKIRFPATSGIGIKPVSIEGTKRLMRKAVQYAIDNDRRSVTIVHKGNIMKFTEGGFRDWALRAGAEGIRRAADRRRPVVQVQEPEDRARDHRQGRHRRCIPAADPAAAGRVRRHRHAQPQRRLHLGRARRAGRRHRHRARREHVGHGGDVRGHARHRAQVRGQGLRQPGIGNPLRGDDARAHGLEGSRGAGGQESRKGDRRQGCDLRLRAPDGRREAGVLLRLRPGDDREDVATSSRPARSAARSGRAYAIDTRVGIAGRAAAQLDALLAAIDVCACRAAWDPFRVNLDPGSRPLPRAWPG